MTPRDFPTIDSERAMSIAVDADLGRPTDGYTEEEKAFRIEVEKDINKIHDEGGMVDFGPGYGADD